MKKRIGILTGGGDVPPLNAVIQSVCDEAKPHDIEVVGLTYGWQGLLDKSSVDLTRLKVDPAIGGTVLRSSRVNLGKIDNAFARITESLDALRLDGLIIIGGEDTLSNAFHLRDIPQVLISKTIDNDVGINEDGRMLNFFTLGYPTAAQRISSLVSLRDGLRTTAYSHERIIVVESMGMHAGWLAISSAMGHPDFIVIPEFPLDYDSFAQKVSRRFYEQRNVIVVISEGAKWSDGSYISANEEEKDNFGHPKFKGAAETLANRLKEDLRSLFDTRNVNSVNPSYLYRSGTPNALDLASAAVLGKDAISLLRKGITEPVFLTLNSTSHGLESEPYYLRDLSDIEDFHRFVDARFYDQSVFGVTDEGKKYLSKIVSDLGTPVYGFSQQHLQENK